MFFSLFEFAACLSILCLYIFFLNCFMERRQNINIVLIIVSCLAYLACTYLPLEYPLNTITSLLGMILQLLISMELFSSHFVRKLALCFGYNLLDICFTMGVMFIFQYCWSIPKETLFLIDSLPRILFLLTTNSGQLFGIIILSKLSNRKKTELSVRHLLLFALLFAETFIAVFLTHLIIMSNESLLTKKIGLGICAVFVISTLVSLFLMNQLEFQQELLIQNWLLHMQLSGQKKQLISYQENEKQLQIQRHNLKRYLTQYLELLRIGKTEEVITELEAQCQTANPFPSEIYSENYLLNALLSKTADLCQQNNILFKSSVSVPANFNDIEIAVIISNLLDNAVDEEIKIPNGNRSIQIESACIGDKISVITRNYITTSILISNPELRSTKRNKHLHGFGLKSVKQLVYARNGIIDIYEENDYFCVHFLMQYRIEMEDLTNVHNYNL